MHTSGVGTPDKKETLRAWGSVKLPFAGYSAVRSLKNPGQGPRSEIVWDDPPSAFARSASVGGQVATFPSSAGLPAVAYEASVGGTPGSKYAGGHRSRVTPVPIPNTEVKPATADGTAWETAWESRSLQAVIPRAEMSSSSRPFVVFGNFTFLRSRRSVGTEAARTQLPVPWHKCATA